MRHRVDRKLSAYAMGLLLLACGGPAAEGPEAEIRGLVALVERAAEEKDLGAVKAFIADDYSDERGNDKSTLGRILALHFMRNQAIYLLTRIESIEMESPRSAALTLYAGMAGGALHDVRARGRGELPRRSDRPKRARRPFTHGFRRGASAPRRLALMTNRRKG